jgi:hypothetical protein
MGNLGSTRESEAVAVQDQSRDAGSAVMSRDDFFDRAAAVEIDALAAGDFEFVRIES